jgi:hypothetical protein
LLWAVLNASIRPRIVLPPGANQHLDWLAEVGARGFRVDRVAVRKGVRDGLDDDGFVVSPRS